MFFDNLFNNQAVYDRLLPLKFKGRMDVAQYHNNFDINEVAPGGDEWDANVGARLLYRIANLAAKSNGKIRWKY